MAQFKPRTDEITGRRVGDVLTPGTVEVYELTTDGQAPNGKNALFKLSPNETVSGRMKIQCMSTTAVGDEVACYIRLRFMARTNSSGQVVVKTSLTQPMVPKYADTELSSVRFRLVPDPTNQTVKVQMEADGALTNVTAYDITGWAILACYETVWSLS